MKKHTLILYPAFAFLIIGLYEMAATGPSSGYWAIMLAVAMFFWYLIRKSRN